VSSHVFIAEPGLVAMARVGSTLVLAGAEGRHAATVARVRRGEVIEVVDGQGTRLRATVLDHGRDEVAFEVSQIEVEPEPSPRFAVVQALPKGEHADLAVDQLTQAGADRIVPWAASNCVVRWDDERARKGQGRWQQEATRAAKQSRRSRIPQVDPLARTPAIEAAVREADLAIMLHEEATEPLAEVTLPGAGTVLIIVGPEGGLDPDERAALSAAGAREVRLGAAILRTSLAGAMALAVLSAQDRWRSTSGTNAPVHAMEGWRA